MEELRILIGKHQYKLGDKIEKEDKIRKIRNVTVVTDDNDRLVMLEIPIMAYSKIEFRGKTFKDIVELCQSEGIKYNQHILCCGEGEDSQFIDEKDIDLSTCPFDCTNVKNCCNICHDVYVYRGKDTIGFDMANVIYKHFLTCTVIAMPGYAWRINK